MKTLTDTYFRKARIEDVDNIVCCIASALDDFKEMPLSQHFFSRVVLQEILNDEKFHYFIAELRTEVIGVIAYKEPAHIYHFFIHSTVQGRGLGTQILNQVLEIIIKNQVNLITVNASLNSVLFYENFGFIQKSGIESIEDMKFIKMEKAI